MVAVGPIERLDVQRQAGVDRERLEELAHQLDVEGADLLASEIRRERPGTVVPTRRSRRGSASRPSAAGSRRSARRRACRRAPGASAWPSAMPTSSTVWWSSMCRSPSARMVDVDQRMARELIEHMVEEADAGRNVRLARTVEVDGDLDRGLVGLARNGALAHDLALRMAKSLGGVIASPAPIGHPEALYRVAKSLTTCSSRIVRRARTSSRIPRRRPLRTARGFGRASASSPNARNCPRPGRRRSRPPLLATLRSSGAPDLFRGAADNPATACGC